MPSQNNSVLIPASSYQHLATYIDKVTKDGHLTPDSDAVSAFRTAFTLSVGFLSDLAFRINKGESVVYSEGIKGAGVFREVTFLDKKIVHDTLAREPKERDKSLDISMDVDRGMFQELNFIRSQFGLKSNKRAARAAIETYVALQEKTSAIVFVNRDRSKREIINLNEYKLKPVG